MTQIWIEPQLAEEGLMVCVIEAVPAQPSVAGTRVYTKLWNETVAELRDRRNSPLPTISALKALQEQYRGRGKPIELPPERLARSILEGRFKQISPMVDVYNLWSARMGLCIGGFDADRVQGTIAVRRTNGSENFHPIGAPRPSKVAAEGFAYVDERSEVLCWLDVRQGESTKLTEDTRNALLLIEGIRPMTLDDLLEKGNCLVQSLIGTSSVGRAKVVEVVSGQSNCVN